jgi:hypothetical protein
VNGTSEKQSAGDFDWSSPARNEKEEGLQLKWSDDEEEEEENRQPQSSPIPVPGSLVSIPV